MRQMPARPARQHRDRVARRGQCGVDREVGQRRARRPHLGEARAHHARHRLGRRDLDDIDPLQPRLVLVARVPHARLRDQRRLVQPGDERRRQVPAGIEQQALLLDRARVLARARRRQPQRGESVGGHQRLDRGQARTRGFIRPRHRAAHGGRDSNLPARPGQRAGATVRSMKKTILIALAALGILAPAAHASTVSFAPDGAIVVTAGDEVNSLGIQSDPTDATRVRFYEGQPGLTVSAPAPCDQLYDDLVSCPLPAAGVRLSLAGGDDSSYVSSDLPNVPIAISGGAGNDWLRADTQATTLDGGAGDDRLDGGKGPDTLLGGDGKDQLDGRQGADRLDGGAGDDVLNGDANKTPSPDVLDGGPGYDTIESDWEYDWDPVAITLSGGADDGFAGEGDDVRNVEKVQPPQPSTLTGSDPDEYLEVVQVTSPSTIRSAGGNDTLRGSDGAETLDGGPGNDDVDGGMGDGPSPGGGGMGADTIAAGPGRDSIAGARRAGDCGPIWCKLPFGNDTIDARDGEV